MGQFGAGAFVVMHYIRVYSYKVTKEKTYELKLGKKYVFYFTIFMMILLIIMLFLNLVKYYLIIIAIIMPLTWFKKLHTIYKFTKNN